jgi:hypothetical protein|tara:strand:+ start:73 stop:603 length:531 start_codon:yes stop_codon:yes gene_type:complete
MSNREKWQPTQYPDYLVSNKGRVKSLKYTKGQHFRLLSQNPDKNGYFCVTLFPDKKYIKAKVHRLVAEAFCKGKSEEKKWALHKDGNNQNNNASNLYWGTPADNFRDMLLHGRAKNLWTSKKNVARKLKIQSVKRIKRILKEDKSWGVQSRLAREYNVAPKTINDIKEGKSWQHIV